MEGRGDLLFYHGFIDRFLGAIRFEFGAVIVRVLSARFLYFLFGGYGSTALSAYEEPLEGKWCCLMLGEHFFLFEPIEIGLDFVPEFLWNERRVRSSVEFVVPLKISIVERIAKKPMHGAFGERSSVQIFFESFGGYEALCFQLLAQGNDGVGAGSVEFKHSDSDVFVHLINNGDAFPVSLSELIANREIRARVYTALRLLIQSLARLFAQVVYIVFRHEDFDPMDELLVRGSLFSENLIFLDEVYGETEVVDDHVVLEVSVEPVGFLDEYRLDILVVLDILDHFSETASAGAFRGFVVLKLSDDIYPVCLGKVREQSPLGGYGISLQFLLS